MQILSFIPYDDVRWAITWRVLAALYFNAVLIWNWRLHTKLERLNKEPQDIRAVLSDEARGLLALLTETRAAIIIERASSKPAWSTSRGQTSTFPRSVVYELSGRNCLAILSDTTRQTTYGITPFGIKVNEARDA